MSGKVDLDRWGPHLRAAHRAGKTLTQYARERGLPAAHAVRRAPDVEQAGQCRERSGGSAADAAACARAHEIARGVRTREAACAGLGCGAQRADAVMVPGHAALARATSQRCCHRSAVRECRYGARCRGNLLARGLAVFRLNAARAVYVHRDAVDFRKSINGLAALVEQALGLDPFACAL